MNATTETVVGVDTAKQVFQLHWVDAETGEVFSKRLKRAKFLEHFVNKAACLIGTGGRVRLLGISKRGDTYADPWRQVRADACKGARQVVAGDRPAPATERGGGGARQQAGKHDLGIAGARSGV